MKILFAGNKERGAACLRALVAQGHHVVGVIAHQSKSSTASNSVVETAQKLGLPFMQPADVNATDVLESLRRWAPELTVLAGYGPIVSREFIESSPLGCINLHGGKLPRYRGSSPMNWALINGDKEFTLTIIRVAAGVDTGDVLAERTFPISLNDTIDDLQKISNRVFPELLLGVIAQIEDGSLEPKVQDNSRASYYPLRFPDDGLILWDLLTAEEIHNRIRALTDPYPGAYSFFNGKKVTFVRSKLAKRTFYGEPGRVYLKNENGLLVCASDLCLWIQKARIEGEEVDVFEFVTRYGKFATVRDLAVAGFANQSA
jgi:methionyl-tRNA formyltransferase